MRICRFQLFSNLWNIWLLRTCVYLLHAWHDATSCFLLLLFFSFSVVVVVVQKPNHEIKQRTFQFGWSWRACLLCIFRVRQCNFYLKWQNDISHFKGKPSQTYRNQIECHAIERRAAKRMKKKQTAHNPVELSEKSFCAQRDNQQMFPRTHSHTEPESERHILPSRLSAPFHEWIHKYTNWSTWNSKRHIHFVIELSARKGTRNTGKRMEEKEIHAERISRKFISSQQQKIASIVGWWYKPFSSSSRSLDHFNESQAKNKVPKKELKKKHLHVA